MFSRVHVGIHKLFVVIHEIAVAWSVIDETYRGGNNDMTLGLSLSFYNNMSFV